MSLFEAYPFRLWRGRNHQRRGVAALVTSFLALTVMLHAPLHIFRDIGLLLRRSVRCPCERLGIVECRELRNFNSAFAGGEVIEGIIHCGTQPARQGSLESKGSSRIMSSDC